MRQLVIIAGGQGTRLTKSGIHVPKLLLRVEGKTILEYFMQEAILGSYTEILLLLGHQSDEVIAYINSAEWPIPITYHVESERLGTTGALIQGMHKLKDEFTLVLGDLVVKDVNFAGTLNFFIKSKMDAIVYVKYSDHPEDSDLVEIDDFSRIKYVDKYPHVGIPTLTTSLAGVAHLKKSILPQKFDKQEADFFGQALNTLVSSFSIFAIYHQGIVRDVGTLERLEKSTKVIRENTAPDSEKKGLFLDRDGTLIEDVPYNIQVDKVQVLETSKEVLQIGKSHFDVTAVVTNQPLVARGDGTVSDVVAVNQEILRQLDLGKEDAIEFFICPHHPDRGYVGEVSSLKIKCTCRKPEVELFLKAAHDYRLLLTNCIVVGDSDCDVSAALKIGSPSIHIHSTSKDEITTCAFQDVPTNCCTSLHDLLSNLRRIRDCL